MACESIYDARLPINGRSIALYKLAKWKNGMAFKKADFSSTGLPIIKIAELNGGISDSTAWTEGDYGKDVFLTKGDYVFSWSGNPETSIDIFRYNLQDGWLNQHIFKVTPETSLVREEYFFFLMKWLKPVFKKIAANKQTTGLGHVTLADLKRIQVTIPSFEVQERIERILCPLDFKIRLNNQLNDYLEQLLMTSQRKISEVEALTSVRADEAFDIHIGKTPPRKESEWFSPNSNNNVVWMSIKDMGCGDVYLMDSSEYLTQKAVAKHNMKLCKPGSVLLSFKLTIGRVGIVSKEMTTNEAIACFSSDDPRKLAYLYPLLKSYDYASLGSTSSIATAVNSKMIKSMLLRMPSTSVLDQFYEQTKPLYEMLQNKVKENVSLTALRDVLLPKLMSGEIDVSKVDLTQLTNNHLADC